MERKVMADYMQARLGPPMRVGHHGLLQPIADAVEFFENPLKEDIIRRGGQKGLSDRAASSRDRRECWRCRRSPWACSGFKLPT